MKIFRISALSIIFIGLCVTAIQVIRIGKNTPFDHSLSPFFVNIAKPVKSVDRVISKLSPVDEIDEKLLGEELKNRIKENLGYRANLQFVENYLDILLCGLTKDSKKPFSYKAFVIEGAPNAYALPGGVICITKEMMDLFENEAELVAIIAHEIGHIERGHLFDLYREKMMSRKLSNLSGEQIISYFVKDLMQLIYCKSEEDEADDFGYRTLIKHGYDPHAASSVFSKLIQLRQEGAMDPNLVEDIYATHPQLEHRCEKYASKALTWKKKHPRSKYYLGEKNLKSLICKFQKEFTEEFTSSF